MGTRANDLASLITDGNTIDSSGIGTGAITNTKYGGVLSVDGSGNVGIGTTSPAEKLDVNGSIGLAGKEIARRSGNNVLLGDVNAAGGGGAVTIRTSGGDKLTIDSSGDVGIGTSSPKGQLHVHRAGTEPTFGGNVAAFSNTTGGAAQLSLLSANTTVCDFLFSDTDSLSVGRIRYSHVNNGMQFSTNGTSRMDIASNGNIGVPGNATAIYSASDERLKKDITGLSGSLSKVQQLRPVSFNWKAGFCPGEDDKTFYGFVAQEVETVDSNLVENFGGGSVTIPGEAGEPDTVVDEPMRINEKFIVPLLTAAIQEQQTQIEAQQATIEALEARLTALEGV